MSHINNGNDNSKRAIRGTYEEDAEGYPTSAQCRIWVEEDERKIAQAKLRAETIAAYSPYCTDMDDEVEEGCGHEDCPVCHEIVVRYVVTDAKQGGSPLAYLADHAQCLRIYGANSRYTFTRTEISREII